MDREGTETGYSYTPRKILNRSLYFEKTDYQENQTSVPRVTLVVNSGIDVQRIKEGVFSFVGKKIVKDEINLVFFRLPPP